MSRFHSPVWDRGDPIDGEMLAFTVGDDPSHDERLVEVDLRGSIVHVEGLAKAKLIEEGDAADLLRGLETLLDTYRRAEWTLDAGDEDVHSAVERRLVDLIGEAGKRLHTGRSRNDQIALDMRLWLREAVDRAHLLAHGLQSACGTLAAQHGSVFLPGYTHMRRAMPSSVADWIGAHARAIEADRQELEQVWARLAECPLGSGAGYGVPLPLDREYVAEALGFERPEEPVTYTQHSRGRAELAYVTALEGLALDVGKLVADLWLFGSDEFGFCRLPVELTTGSSLMPHKRNPDVLELARAHCRQVVADRAALLDVLRDLPSGYHRDFQLLKPPLFRAHDRMIATLPIVARVLEALEFDEQRLGESSTDPRLGSTERALARVRSEGVAFREAYVDESRG